MHQANGEPAEADSPFERQIVENLQKLLNIHPPQALIGALALGRSKINFLRSLTVGVSEHNDDGDDVASPASLRMPGSFRLIHQ